jgi:type 1 fimbria pilin
MANFKFQKSALAISSAAALTLFSLASQAQSANDFGELLIEGQISNTTCALTLGDPQSTGANKKTMNLGTYSTTVAGASASGSGDNIGAAKSTVLSVKNADGTACNFSGATNWDVGINLSSTNYETVTGGFTVLKSTAVSGTAATGVGVKLSTTKGPAASTTTGATAVNFASGNGSYGTLLSGAASSPGVLPDEVIAVTAQMVRANGPVGVGVFTHSIPLNVWYR